MADGLFKWTLLSSITRTEQQMRAQNVTEQEPEDRAEQSVSAALNQDDQQTLREKQQALFIQQFKKEAQARIDELESQLETNLKTIEKSFDIELMKMPPSLQKMRMGDLLNGLSPKEFFEKLENQPHSTLSDVSIVVKSELDSYAIPPQAGSSRSRVKRAASSSKIDAQKTMASKGGKMRTLVNSYSAGSLSLRSCKTRSCVAKSGDQAATPKPQLRSSVVDLQLTLWSAQGKNVRLTEANKEDIDLSELDAGAVEQFNKMKELLDFLVGKINQPQ